LFLFALYCFVLFCFVCLFFLLGGGSFIFDKLSINSA
jgi:hypothetical protein